MGRARFAFALLAQLSCPHHSQLAQRQNSLLAELRPVAIAVVRFAFVMLCRPPRRSLPSSPRSLSVVELVVVVRRTSPSPSILQSSSSSLRPK